MKANTRLFGEIEIAEDKLIVVEQGIIGFPDLKNFALIFDEEKGDSAKIKWFQSLDEPGFAMPVMDPYEMVPDYALEMNEEGQKILGELTTENVFVLVTVTVPQDLEQISINLKAPIIINTDTNKACQIIADADYPVKYKIYDLLEKNKKEGGE